VTARHDHSGARRALARLWRWSTAQGTLRWALTVASGLFAGVGLYTFGYAEGLSYLSADPRACVNCHIMRPEYDGWQKGGHHTAAVCVDCHLPAALGPKLLAKAENGWRHSTKFTTGSFVEPIVIQPRGREILQQSCLRCHAEIVAALGAGDPAGPGGVDCVHCHADVGHGERAALGGPYRRGERTQSMTGLEH
jgi:cytochrome c nitrite reductase small subunit